MRQIPHPASGHPLPEGAGAGGPRAIIRYRDGATDETNDHLAIEEPLEIRVRGRAISVTMRTPGHDDELAAGFLLSESIVTRPGVARTSAMKSASEFLPSDELTTSTSR